MLKNRAAASQFLGGRRQAAGGTPTLNDAFFLYRAAASAAPACTSVHSKCHIAPTVNNVG
jgi:hypothetical protein